MPSKSHNVIANKTLYDISKAERKDPRNSEIIQSKYSDIFTNIIADLNKFENTDNFSGFENSKTIPAKHAFNLKATDLMAHSHKTFLENLHNPELFAELKLYANELKNEPIPQVKVKKYLEKACEIFEKLNTYNNSDTIDSKKLHEINKARRLELKPLKSSLKKFAQYCGYSIDISLDPNSELYQITTGVHTLSAETKLALKQKNKKRVRKALIAFWGKYSIGKIVSIGEAVIATVGAIPYVKAIASSLILLANLPLAITPVALTACSIPLLFLIFFSSQHVNDTTFSSFIVKAFQNLLVRGLKNKSSSKIAFAKFISVCAALVLGSLSFTSGIAFWPFSQPVNYLISATIATASFFAYFSVFLDVFVNKQYKFTSPKKYFKQNKLRDIITDSIALTLSVSIFIGSLGLFTNAVTSTFAFLPTAVNYFAIITANIALNTFFSNGIFSMLNKIKNSIFKEKSTANYQNLELAKNLLSDDKFSDQYYNHEDFYKYQQQYQRYMDNVNHCSTTKRKKLYGEACVNAFGYSLQFFSSDKAFIFLAEALKFARITEALPMGEFGVRGLNFVSYFFASTGANTTAAGNATKTVSKLEAITPANQDRLLEYYKAIVAG